MRILILEDESIRREEFEKCFKDGSITFCDTADQAIKLLNEEQWDEVWLDHDLGDYNGKRFLNPYTNNGYVVAQWLEKHPRKKPKTIYIHSINSVGAANMKSALPEAIQIPFYKLFPQSPTGRMFYGLRGAI